VLSFRYSMPRPGVESDTSRLLIRSITAGVKLLGTAYTQSFFFRISLFSLLLCIQNIKRILRDHFAPCLCMPSPFFNHLQWSPCRMKGNRLLVLPRTSCLIIVLEVAPGIQKHVFPYKIL
jgi:hypothetical protein